MKHNLIGQIFGNWTVLNKVYSDKIGTVYECICKCGNLKNIYRGNLLSGKTKSCGCLKGQLIAKKKLKHGHSKSKNHKPSKVYSTWSSMLTRCTNKNNKRYKDYGERGISVCERWKIFENFLEDMGMPPANNYSIDRIDNNGIYEKNNCRWASKKTQSRNKRTVKLNKNIVNKLRNGNISIKQVIEETGCCLSTAYAAKNGDNWK